MMTSITNLFYVMLPFGIILPIIMRLLGERWAGQGLGASSSGKPHRWAPQFIAFVVVVALIVTVSFFSLLLPILERGAAAGPR
jgi:hypothetical protein